MGLHQPLRAGANPTTNPILNRLVDYAVRYYRDFVLPEKKFRAPTAAERAALEDLAATLATVPAGADAEALQNQVYEVGKRHNFENLRDWFRTMYEVMFGQSQGPRMGSFIALFGVNETITLIRQALSSAFVSEAPAAVS